MRIPPEWDGHTTEASRPGLRSDRGLQFFDLTSWSCLDFAAIDEQTLACLQVAGELSFWSVAGVSSTVVVAPPCGRCCSHLVVGENPGEVLLHGCCADHIWKLSTETGEYERVDLPDMGIGLLGCHLGHDRTTLVHRDGRIVNLS
jgi:hypothetical protein